MEGDWQECFVMVSLHRRELSLTAAEDWQGNFATVHNWPRRVHPLHHKACSMVESSQQEYLPPVLHHPPHREW
jgi:hypothetical protein